MEERGQVWALDAAGGRRPAQVPPPAPPEGGARLGFRGATVDRDRYLADVRWLIEQIRAGEIYQANYTFGLELDLEGDPWPLYGRLRRAQPVAYGAYLQIDPERALLSLSPELFFRWEGERIVTAPMKGTRPRGRTPEEDGRLARELAASEKDRAENVMIVDLLRNDLGRLAEPGSVRVPTLFRVERYPTVHQMISVVEARLPDDVGFPEIVAALFPCGSVTGAPKVRAMELLAEREAAERGPYCGAVGILFPWREAVFNVAIRTLAVRGEEAWYGVGGGIVFDSEPEGEWREAFWKARFLFQEAEWEGVRRWAGL